MGTLSDSIWGVAGDAGDPLLVVELVERDGEPLLVLTGELCLATGSALEEAFQRHRSDLHGKLRIDLAGVSFLDAAGLSSLLRCVKATGDGAAPCIVEASTPVRRILELTSTGWLLCGGDGPRSR